MAAHNENDFVEPILSILKDYGECTTKFIISKIPEYMELNEDDFSEIISRNNDMRYKQIVRNVISHKNKTLFRKADIKKRINKETKKEEKVLFLKSEDSIEISLFDLINNNKKNNENEVIEDEAIKENQETSKDNIAYIDDDIDIYDQKLLKRNNLSEKPKTDASVAEMVKRINNYQCLYTKLTNGPELTFEKPDGTNYIHAHHLIPMSSWKDFFPKNLDRPSNIVPIATFYHDILHHGTIEEKRPILLALYNAMIPGLNADGIYISFETLLEKYY